MACEHMFGPLPIPEPASSPTSGSGNRIFPHNVSFRTADWVQEKIPEDIDGYDVVLAFVDLSELEQKDTDISCTGSQYRNGYI